MFGFYYTKLFFFPQRGEDDCPSHCQVCSTLLLAKFWRQISPKKGLPLRIPDVHDREDVERDHLIQKLVVYLHLQIQSSSEQA